MGLIDTGCGIHNPAELLARLSVVSVPDSPYEDSSTVRLGVSLIYFARIQPSVYSAIYPVYAVEVDRNGGGVLLDLTGEGDGVMRLGGPASEQRRYASSIARRRLHQVAFHNHALLVYRSCCAVCPVEEPVLLDASRIVGDAEGGGLAACYPNGRLTLPAAQRSGPQATWSEVTARHATRRQPIPSPSGRAPAVPAPGVRSGTKRCACHITLARQATMQRA